jgi:ABC-type transport system substrate-binding protein
LLDHFGYKKGADGYRNHPDGKTLVVDMRRESSALYVELAELWKKNLDAVGLRLKSSSSSFADNLKAATQCKLAMWGGAWHGDIPEGENFVQLLYGPNSGQGNHSCYRSKAYDALYEQAVKLPAGPERHALYREMTRQMEADVPWVLHATRIRNWLIRPGIQGFKRHPFLKSDWQYLDVAPTGASK